MQYLFIFKNIQKSFLRDTCISVFGFVIGFFINLYSFHTTSLIALFVGAISYVELKKDSRNIQEVRNYLAGDILLSSMLCISFVNSSYILNSSSLYDYISLVILFCSFRIFDYKKFSVVGYTYNMSRTFGIFLSAILSAILSIITTIFIVSILSRLIIGVNLGFITRV